MNFTNCSRAQLKKTAVLLFLTTQRILRVAQVTEYQLSYKTRHLSARTVKSLDHF